MEDLKSVLNNFKQEILSLSPQQKQATLEQLQLSKNTLANLFIPKEIDMPKHGSIAKLQPNVIETKLGND